MSGFHTSLSFVGGHGSVQASHYSLFQVFMLVIVLYIVPNGLNKLVNGLYKMVNGLYFRFSYQPQFCRWS